MKLIHVVHNRCGEPQGSTYLIAPDDKTNDDIERDVKEVTKEHLERLKKEKSQRPEHFDTNLHRLPETMTIAEVKAKEKEYNEAEKIWDRERIARTQSFGQLMKERGYMPLGWLGEKEIPTFQANWGHSHGLSFGLDWSCSKTDFVPSNESGDYEDGWG